MLPLINQQPPQEVVAPAEIIIESQPQSVSKFVSVLLVAICLLLVILVGLTFLVLTKQTSSGGSGVSQGASQTNSKNPATALARQVIQVAPTRNQNLEYYIYEPKQNTSNTTIYFGVHNKCKNCGDTISTADVVTGFATYGSSYLLDDDAGKKYYPINDAEGKVLATPECSGWIKDDATIDCFVSFSKAQSKTTVSWVFAGTRIDNIPIP